MEEKEGGVGTERHSISGFREDLDSCDLRDLGYKRQWHTWEKGLSVSTINRERLDRFCGNSVWFSLFPNTFVEHLVRIKSDHSPIIVRQRRAKKKRRRGKKSFQV